MVSWMRNNNAEWILLLPFITITFHSPWIGRKMNWKGEKQNPRYSGYRKSRYAATRSEKTHTNVSISISLQCDAVLVRSPHKIKRALFNYRYYIFFASVNPFLTENIQQQKNLRITKERFHNCEIDHITARGAMRKTSVNLTGLKFQRGLACSCNTSALPISHLLLQLIFPRINYSQGFVYISDASLVMRLGLTLVHL